MSNVPEVYLLQAAKRNLELAKAFQEEMGGHFFEHVMYDVKDALTSILALCDMEDMKQMPQVKKYIQRVTELLQDVRKYHVCSQYNVNHVLINVINLVKDKYKSKLQINEHLSFIKANAKSDRIMLEQIMLYSLIEAAEASPGPVKLEVELVQKERDAVITWDLKGFRYSPVILKEIHALHKPTSTFRMQLNETEEGTEMILRLPLSFEARESTAPMFKIELGQIKTVQKPHVLRAHGAQERT